MGDFNARVGGEEDVWEGVKGRHGIGKVNENGVRLLEFCMGNELAIMGTFFRHQDSEKWTWMDSGNKGRMIDHCHMIDHVLVEQKRRGAIEDVRTVTHVEHGNTTNHRLVRIKINIKLLSTTKRRGREWGH
jgi:hypothetical protein